MIDYNDMKLFYQNRKILITGHTGFKGTWLCAILNEMGAKVFGYALEPESAPNLYDLINMNNRVKSYIGDIRCLDKLKKAFDEIRPEIVIHMAAQPIVRKSYSEPVYTYETNVIGTVNLLECCRLSNNVKSVINVTTDKVYYNEENGHAYREEDRLDGYDPYSNSKSCSELVTSSYARSFLRDMGIRVSTCRAGNVIGGGDFAKDRIIPDCVRAAFSGEKIIIRNPSAIRPFQHVLEPLFVYLYIAMEQISDKEKAGNYNVGPDESNCVNARTIAERFCETWNRGRNSEKALCYECKGDNGPHEAGLLRLDCAKVKNTFGWEPKWSIDEAIDKIVEFEKIRYREGASSDTLYDCITKQIQEYINV